MMWDEEVSEGAHVGTRTHQGEPGGAGVPRWVVPTWCTPSDVICIKNSEKSRIKFSGHSENFYFGVIFYCMGNSENRINMAFYFI